MSKLDDVRAQYPEYSNWSDEELAEGLREKFYADMPVDQYYAELGMPYTPASNEPAMAQPSISDEVIEGLTGILPTFGNAIMGLGEGVYDLGGGNIETNESPFQIALKSSFGFNPTGDYGAKRGLQSLAAGSMRGARNVLNAPNQAVEWLKKHGAPEWLSAWKPSDAIQNADYNQIVGLEGERPGDVLLGSFGEYGTAGALTGNPAVGVAVNEAGAGRNPISGLGAFFLPKALGKTKQGISKLNQMRPDVKRQALENQILETKRSQLNETQSAKTLEQSIAEELQGRKLKPTEVGEHNVHMARQFKDYYKKQQEISNKNYTDFKQSEYGQLPTKELTAQELKINENNLSPEAKALVKKVLGSKYEKTGSIIDPNTGKPVTQTIVEPGQANVSNYIDLSKELRDVAEGLRKEANNPTSQAQKAVAMAERKRILAAKQKVDQAVNEALPQEGKDLYSSIQEHNKNFVQPFKNKTFLEDMLENHPKVSKTSLLEKFDTEGLPDLKKAILSDANLKSVIGRHELNRFDFNTGKGIRQFLESDAVSTLEPKEIQPILDKFAQLEGKKALIDALKTKLAESGLEKQEINARIGKYQKIVSAYGKLKAAEYVIQLLAGA